MDEVVTFVQGLMDRDYASYDDVPYHSRWRHFEVGAIDRAGALKRAWMEEEHCDALEMARRLVNFVFTD